MWSPLKHFSKFGFENKTFEDVKVFEIVDGDTLKCFVDLGSETVFGRKVWLTVRLAEIDAPELKGESVTEKVCAMIALLTLVEMICSGLDFVSNYSAEVKKICGCVVINGNVNITEEFNETLVELNKKYKDLVSRFLKDNFDKLPTFRLETQCMDLYGRVVGKLYKTVSSSKETDSLNDSLCSKGVVRYYKGNRCREKWRIEDLSKIIISFF